MEATELQVLIEQLSNIGHPAVYQKLQELQELQEELQQRVARPCTCGSQQPWNVCDGSEQYGVDYCG
ncbi:MAG: hypothetical protein HC910_22855 [Spirulinaceae cyanobacterium SM2_1_0]|nr:hypothetical protein [Spirulinaceae cyanobacterium SM2_1_0]